MPKPLAALSWLLLLPALPGHVPCIADHAGPKADDALFLEPYVDPTQLDIPWPKHSHVKQPWRGYLETKPAVDLLEGIGVCYHHQRGSMEVQLGLLAACGMRCVRWEQPFGTYDPDRSALAVGPEAKFRELLRACKRHDLIPVILLNAHHGAPCKLRTFDRRVAVDTPKGSKELVLDSVEDLRPVHCGLSNLTAYWAAEVLFTEIDAERKAAKLSKPLPKDLKRGERVSVADLEYLPLHPVGTPELERTAAGWVDYARSICRVAREEGVTIELEVWNELSFGSHYFGGEGINRYWPGRARFTKDFLRPGGHAWEVARRTVDMVKREYPDVKVIWGFSNTTFFHCPIADLPPGTDGQSYHPYGTGWRRLPESEQSPDQPWRCMEGHCPEYRMVLAEGWAHTAIQCETLMRLLRPDRRLTTAPEGTERFRHYITEHGIVPAEAGVEGDEASLRLKQKFLVRAVLFWLHKGIDRLMVFQAGPEEHDHGMAVLPATAGELAALPPEGEIEGWLSPALLSLRRTVKAFDGARAVEAPRSFSVLTGTAADERKVFEMPEGKPELTYRDLFTLLPFQLDGRTFVFAYYVMSPRYAVEDLPEEIHRLSIRPLRGRGAEIRCLDPLSNLQVEAGVVERGEDSLTVDVRAIDTPRLLIVKEREAPSSASLPKTDPDVVRATAVLLDRIAGTAVANAALPVRRDAISDFPARRVGDALTEHYVRQAAQAAVELPEDIAARAFLLALGLGLDRSGVLATGAPWSGIHRAVESADERARRLEVLGEPTMRGRADLAQHFVVSCFLTAVHGPELASAAGVAKELLDARTRSGFSVDDLAADRAGIAFAADVLSGRRTLARIAESFSVADCLPEP